MMSIQKMNESRFLLHHTQKFTTILLCLINMMKLFMKMMKNDKIGFNKTEIDNIIREINLYMASIKKIFGQWTKNISKGYWNS
jgi:hypothetical protein